MRIKKSLSPVMLLLATGFSGISWGHQTVGEGISAPADIRDVDVFHTSCFSYVAGNVPVAPAGEPMNVAGAADRFSAQIRRDSGTGSVRVTLGRITGPAGSFNPVTGANPSVGFSPAANDNATLGLYGTCTSITSAAGQGNGLYQFAVSHTTAVANTYTVNFHCEKVTAQPACSQNIAAQHTGTGVTPAGMPDVNSTANQHNTGNAPAPSDDYRKIINR